MKTYYFIFLCFFALLISVVTIQSFEDEKNSEVEELKTNFEVVNFHTNLINKGGQRRWAKHFPQWGDTKPRVGKKPPRYNKKTFDRAKEYKTEKEKLKWEDEGLYDGEEGPYDGEEGPVPKTVI
uniref:Glycine-rich protein n=1 Tax=Ononis spinosa TaxID=58890 RepID=A0A411AFJ3_ONOSP|nr:glycine-rich protein [Ononis spinosa]